MNSSVAEEQLRRGSANIIAVEQRHDQTSEIV